MQRVITNAPDPEDPDAPNLLQVALDVQGLHSVISTYKVAR